MDSNWATTPVPGGRVGAPSLSPTGALRARLRVETTRRALAELSVLNEQLLDLPERLRANGQAAALRLALRDAMDAFADLAALAWRGLAEDALDQIATTAPYRQYVVAATRRVNQLQQEAATPTTLPGVAPRQRAGPLWSWRVARYENALERMRGALRASQDGPPDLFALGLAVTALRAAAGLAGQSAIVIVAQRGLTLASGITGIALAALMVVAGTTLLITGVARGGGVLSAAALVFALWAFALWLLGGEATLWTRVAGARARLRAAEADVGDVALGLWHGLGLMLAVAADLAAVGGAATLIALAPQRFGLTVARLDARSLAVAFTGGPLTVALGVWAVIFAAPLLVALPGTLTWQAMLARDLATRPGRSPVARRVALPGAIQTLMWHLAPLLAGGLALARLVALDRLPLARIGALQLSWLAPVPLVLVLAAYFAAVEIPYRVGNGRWRRARQASLATRRREIAARLDRLDASPTAPSDVPAMQYDVARLQYLELQRAEAARQVGVPFSLGARGLALLILIAVSLALDLAPRFGPLP